MAGESSCWRLVAATAIAIAINSAGRNNRQHALGAVLTLTRQQALPLPAWGVRRHWRGRPLACKGAMGRTRGREWGRAHELHVRGQLSVAAPQAPNGRPGLLFHHS